MRQSAFWAFLGVAWGALASEGAGQFDAAVALERATVDQPMYHAAAVEEWASFVIRQGVGLHRVDGEAKFGRGFSAQARRALNQGFLALRGRPDGFGTLALDVTPKVVDEGLRSDGDSYVWWMEARGNFLSDGNLGRVVVPVLVRFVVERVMPEVGYPEGLMVSELAMDVNKEGQ